jgi:hypothetical protein
MRNSAPPSPPQSVDEEIQRVDYHQRMQSLRRQGYIQDLSKTTLDRSGSPPQETLLQQLGGRSVLVGLSIFLSTFLPCCVYAIKTS